MQTKIRIAFIDNDEDKDVTHARWHYYTLLVLLTVNYYALVTQRRSVWTFSWTLWM